MLFNIFKIGLVGIALNVLGLVCLWIVEELVHNVLLLKTIHKSIYGVLFGIIGSAFLVVGSWACWLFT